MKKARTPTQVAAFAIPLQLTLTRPALAHSFPTASCCSHADSNRVGRRSALVKFARTILAIPAAVAVLRAGTGTESVAAQPLSCPPGDNTATIDPATDVELLITDTVDIYIRAGDSARERVTLGLFGCVVPRTVETFKQLVTAGSYDNTSIYRIVPSLTVQMGDVLDNGGSSGTQSVEAENYRVIHTVPGIVSLVRDRNGLTDCRFFVATRDGDSQYLDGRYCAFGIVTSGLDKLVALDRFAGRANIPKVPVVIEKIELRPGDQRRKLNDGVKNVEGAPILLKAGRTGNQLT